MEIKNVSVIGAGTMGSGIAQVTAQAGYNVTMEDIGEELLERGLASIDKSLGRGVKKGSISEQDKASIMSRISTAIGLSSAKDADLVIEAVLEELELKLDIFKELDSICREHTILASNTSFWSSVAKQRAKHCISKSRPEERPIFAPPLIAALASDKVAALFSVIFCAIFSTSAIKSSGATTLLTKPML